MMKKGFTLIEVSLFLAVSGLMIVGIIAGTSASIFRQRYNDSVNSFAEFLRDVYSEVINVENSLAKNTNSKCTVTSDTAIVDNTNPGRSECVIYGKLVTFGETATYGGASAANTVHVYDVIGGSTIRISTDDFRVEYETGTDINTIIASLQGVNADVLAPSADGSVVNFAGNHYTYTPEWGATLEKPDGNPFVASLLIVRSPLSGSVHTFVLQNSAISAANEVGRAPTVGNTNYLSHHLATFTNAGNIDFCVASEDANAIAGRRRNVRILADSNSASGVELIPIDTGDSVCNV